MPKGVRVRVPPEVQLKKNNKMEKLMTNKDGEYLYLFDIIKNDKVVGSNTVWSKNIIHARSFNCTDGFSVLNVLSADFAYLFMILSFSDCRFS